MEVKIDKLRDVNPVSFQQPCCNKFRSEWIVSHHFLKMHFESQVHNVDSYSSFFDTLKENLCFLVFFCFWGFFVLFNWYSDFIVCFVEASWVTVGRRASVMSQYFVRVIDMCWITSGHTIHLQFGRAVTPNRH